VSSLLFFCLSYDGDDCIAVLTGISTVAVIRSYRGRGAFFVVFFMIAVQINVGHYAYFSIVRL